ncbi:hypothetical protein CR513_41756, partial [Mucuna pruriens]
MKYSRAKERSITRLYIYLRSTYNFLLRRPWIHPARVVSSSLHQKLKYAMNDKLVVISGKENVMVKCPAPLVTKVAKKAFETAFQSLEVIATAYEEPLSKNMYASKVAIMETKVMLGEGYQLEEGLGK